MMHRPLRLGAASRAKLNFAVLALLAAPAVGQPTALAVKAAGEKTFYVNPRAGNSQVTVFSQSTLEDFTTVCNQVSGQWQVNPRALETLHGHFALRVDDMHTGIALRDHDLRGPEWFDAEHHPEIRIEVAKVEDVKKVDGNMATMKLVGTCSVHGRTNPISIPCTLAYLDESPETMILVKGDVIRIRAEFSLKLSEFGIQGPPGANAVGVKVADKQDVRVTVFGSTERPPEALRTDTEPATTPPMKVKPPERPEAKQPPRR
jgi:polyisoprenoid-binding protein YceI